MFIMHVYVISGLVVKAAGWLSLDRQFEPYPPRAYGGALVVWPGMPFPNLMVEYISPRF